MTRVCQCVEEWLIQRIEDKMMKEEHVRYIVEQCIDYRVMLNKCKKKDYLAQRRKSVLKCRKEERVEQREEI